ncbi:MAG: hypothetical protein ACF8Q5_11505 [Phycisphaerales bacterium JB040]
MRASVETVVCPDGTWLTALTTERDRSGQVRVRASLRTELPSLADADADDAAQSVEEALDDAGIARGNVTLVLPRHAVVEKSLRVECGDLDDNALGTIVRVRLARERGGSLENCLVDYRVVSREGDTAHVIAASVEESRVERYEQLLRSAGRRVRSVRVRTDGLAPFAGEHGTELIVAPTARGAEFAVTVAGSPVFTRACLDAASPDRLQIEADRTVASSRSADPSLSLAEPRFASHPEASVPEGWAPVHAPAGNGPGLRLEPGSDPGLVGLSAEPDGGPHRIDFRNPMTPPDAGAPARQKAMLVALALIAILGTVWVLADMRISELDAQIAAAESAREKAFAGYLDGLTAEARFRHQAEWASVRIDWAGHLERLTGALPPPGDVVLNEIDMRLDSAVRFAPGEGAALPGRWDSRDLVSIEISGKADSRETIQRLRESLLPFGTLTSSGADTEQDFSLRLVTNAELPDAGGEGE